MKQVQKGFTLIELMIVVAIIGILAAVAIPAYSDYTARAQAAEPVELMAGFKTPLAEWYADKGAWPAAIASLGGTTAGKYTAAINGTAGTGPVYTILATMNASGVNSSIQSKTIGLKTSNGGQTWNCDIGTAGGDMPAKYRPGACR